MKVSRIVLSFAAIFSLTFAVAAPAVAVNYGGGSVQAYAAETRIDVGSIVQLTGSEANRVKVATKAELQNMFGVAVDRNQMLVTTSNNLKNETYVAASGTYTTLVSTEGGAISVGDYLTMSSIDGVAMKAGTDESTVFGRANQNFDGKGIVLGTADVKDTSGNVAKKVQLGSVPVTIDIKHNPNDQSTKANLPEILERIGETIAQKEVNPIRIYLSIAILIVTVAAAIVMLYSGIRNSVVSIGRNPMSKKSIFRALVQVILTSLLILIIGVFAVYLLLRL